MKWSTKSIIFSRVPIEFGIEAGYKIRDREEFVHFIMDFDF